MTLLNRTCKQVAALLIAREDRALRLGDRLALRIHMRICDACPRFEGQIMAMRNGLKQWRNYTNKD
jgi:hypothetical protein